MYKIHRGAVETWEPKAKLYTLQFLYQRARYVFRWACEQLTNVRCSTWTPPTVDAAPPVHIESGDAEEVGMYLDLLP